MSKGEIYIVTGAIFDHDQDGDRDADASVPKIPNRNRVAEPTHFYKIILHTRPNTFVESMAFVLPHVDENPSFDNRQDYLTAHLTTIEAIEELADLEFLESLEAENPGKAEAIRGFQAAALWDLPDQEGEGFLDNNCDNTATLAPPF